LRKRQLESVTDLVGGARDERYKQRGCAGHHHCTQPDCAGHHQRKQRGCAGAHTAT
jgi:hypothetical protein